MNARDVAAQIADGGLIRKSGTEWSVCCPAHEDNNPSLTISDGHDGVVLYCHAGCATSSVLDAAGLHWTDLSEDEPEQAETVYDYTDADGHLLYQVVRRPGKRFLQRRPVDGEWVWNLRGVGRVLYRLPEVIKAVAAGEEVWITEGEKDADAVRRHACATTSPGGAGKWRDEYAEPLEGAQVTIWADRDEVGWQHAHQVRESLLAHDVASVRIVESAYGKDAYDHLNHGLGLDDVLVTVPAGSNDAETLFLRADPYIERPIVRGEWAIPYLMRAGERLILTGYEGYGKSALCKQIAVCAAVGLHPFTLGNTRQPKRVVFIDCENPVEDLVEDFERLRMVAREAGVWNDPDLFIQDSPPLDLCGLADPIWLAERARAHQPDLMVLGPMYNLMNGDSAKEEHVRKMLRVLGAVQAEVGCALVIEHHVGHGPPGEPRPIRPIGSSILQRWASFGFGLFPLNRPDKQAFEFRNWRGNRRRDRTWPSVISQVGDGRAGWYWVEDEPV